MNNSATANININTAQALQALDALESRIMAVRSQINQLQGTNRGGFSGLNTGGLEFAATLGVVAGITAGVASKLVEMGQAGVEAMSQIIAEGIELNTQLDTAQVKFTRIFESKGLSREDASAMAGDFVEYIGGMATQLGQSKTDFMNMAAGLSPDVTDVQQLEQLLKLSDAIADDTGRSLDDVRMGFERIASGELAAGLDWLNQEGMKGDIQALIDEGIDPMTASIDVLLQRMKDVGAMSDESAEGMVTFEKSMSMLEAKTDSLKQALTEELFGVLKEDLAGLNTALESQSTELTVVAQQAGSILADLAEVIGGGLTPAISNLPLERVQQFLVYLRDTVSAIQLLGEITGVTAESVQGLGVDFDTFMAVAKGLSPSFAALSRIKEDVEQLSMLLATGKAFAVGLSAALQPIAEIIKKIGEGFVLLASGDFAGAEAKMNEAQAIYNDSLIDMEAGQAAMEASLRKTGQALKSHATRTKENRDEVKKFRDEAEKPAPKAEQFEDVVGKGETVEDDNSEEYLDAREKVNDKMTDLEIDRNRKLEDIASDHNGELLQLEQELGQGRLDLQEKIDQKFLEQEIDNAREREDIARENRQAIDDINRDYLSEVEDTAKDFGRSQKAMARKQANDRVKLETDIANKRVDIERSYRQRLQQIQLQFSQSADDAIRNRDAVAYVNAQRRMKQEVQNAELERSQSVEDANVEAERQREAMRQQQAIEREEAQIAYGQKMEDLQLQHERELEEQRTKHQREIEEQGIKEQRKAEDLQRWKAQEEASLAESEQAKRQKVQESHQAQLDDASKWYTRKLEDLERSLKEELALIEEYEAKKQAAMADSDKQTSNSKPSMGMPHPGLFPGRASGGPVTGGYPYMVGEKGPELFIPPSVGRIMSNKKMMSTFPTGNVGQQIANQLTKNFTINMPKDELTPTQQAQIQNLIVNAIKM